LERIPEGVDWPRGAPTGCVRADMGLICLAVMHHSAHAPSWLCCSVSCD
jgi:hypothetical protein